MKPQPCKPFIVLLSLLLMLPSAHAIEGHDIPLDTHNGTVRVADLQGKVVYLDFWASWCAPCRKSFPWMQQMQAKYADRGLKILAVNVDHSPEDAQRFLDKVPADFLIAYDHEGTLASAVKLKAMPSSFLLDKDGNILETHLGFKQNLMQDYEKEIRTALGLDEEEPQP